MHVLVDLAEVGSQLSHSSPLDKAKSEKSKQVSDKGDVRHKD
jgi:hypothetical protein